MLKDILEIIIITYNRKNKLQKTFEQIFADNSPIKDLQITILDNNSTDGTPGIIEEYKENFSNIKYVKHNKNIGGCANVIRAYEIVSKEYVWVICDDDNYDWDGWAEISQAILSKKYDLIFTTQYLLRNKTDISQLLHQATFVPACIFSTKRINDTIIQNMYMASCTMFPQVMLSAEILANDPGEFLIPSKWVVNRGECAEENDSTLIRGLEKKDVFPDHERAFWHTGFINAVQIIKDKSKRDYIIENTRFNDIFNQSFTEYLHFIVGYNGYQKNHNLKNISELFLNINFCQKISLIKVLFFTYGRDLYKYLMYFYKTEQGFYVCLFNKIKLRIYKYKQKPSKIKVM